MVVAALIGSRTSDACARPQSSLGEPADDTVGDLVDLRDMLDTTPSRWRAGPVWSLPEPVSRRQVSLGRCRRALSGLCRRIRGEEGVMLVQRDRKTATVLITDAAEDPEKELRRREIRYVVMMLVRALCLIGGAVIVANKPPLWGVWLILCVVGMVVLPWLAVVLANDRPAKKRAERRTSPSTTSPAPAELPGAGRVIDPD